MIDLRKGDFLIESDKIESGSVDLILTDLPYGTTACSWDEIIPFSPMWEIFYRVLRPNGFIVLTASQPFTTKLIASNIDNFSHQWIWQKEQGSNPLLANKMPMKNFEDVLVFGSRYDFAGIHPSRPYFKKVFEFIGKTKKSIIEKIGHRVDHTFRFNSSQFSLCTKETYNDLVLYFEIDKMEGFKKYEDIDRAKFKRVYNPQMTEGKKYTSGSGFIEHLGFEKVGGTVSSKRYPTSIIEFATDKSNSQHPTQKPVALMEYLIKTYTNENMTVFDATMGSGSTMVACQNTNRNGIGIEQDEAYFKIAEQRIKENKYKLF